VGVWCPGVTGVLARLGVSCVGVTHRLSRDAPDRLSGVRCPAVGDHRGADVPAGGAAGCCQLGLGERFSG